MSLQSSMLHLCTIILRVELSWLSHAVDSICFRCNDSMLHFFYSRRLQSDLLRHVSGVSTLQRMRKQIYQHRLVYSGHYGNATATGNWLTAVICLATSDFVLGIKLHFIRFLKVENSVERVDPGNIFEFGIILPVPSCQSRYRK